MLQTEKQLENLELKVIFLILLIRAREGVFLLISCCDKLLWGEGGGVTFPPTPLTHKHKHSVLP